MTSTDLDIEEELPPRRIIIIGLASMAALRHSPA
jgi:hypothetical protein